MLEITDNDEVKKALDELFFLPRIFSFQELADAVSNKIESNILKRSIIKDERFISLGQEITDKSLFLSKLALLNKFVFLNQSLCRSNQTRLSSKQVALYLSSLLPSDKWYILPEKILLFGRSIGLIAPAVSSEEYIFPLAHILSYLSPNLVNIAGNILTNLEITENQNVSSGQDLEDLIKECFAGLDERCIYIISNRENLLGSGRKTLEELGDKLGITRERVRQIEKKIWKSLKHPSRKQIFLKAFLLDFVKRQGKLTFGVDTPNAPYRKFIIKCLGIPYAEFFHSGLIVIGASLKDFELPDHPEIMGLKGDDLALFLGSQSKICLSKSEITMLCEREKQFISRRLTKIQKVRLIMRSLGEPTHFSVITEEYNKLFPEDNMRERNVHAILCRETNIFVWLGVKGTYGLKEWGYQRPLKSLYETVTEIVEKSYKRTKKPVPLTVIIAELGKYRQLVNPVSLNFVTLSNPKLQRVSKELFLPKISEGLEKDKNSLDVLDKLLEAFSQKKKS